VPANDVAGPQPAAGSSPSGSDLRREIEAELPFLRRSARRWYRDKANADDLVQDTVLQALANARLWQSDSNLRGWLYTIMRNRFYAAAARSKRSDAVLDAVAAADSAAPAGSSEARLVMRDLERALYRLPSHQQTAIRLVGIDGRSYEEAAQIMEMSVAAVRCHLARGRERLRTMIEGGAGSALPRRPVLPWTPAAPRPAPQFGDIRLAKVAAPA
jgi:RNA polymerase sigma-70 factor (ECF subfamily)